MGNERDRPHVSPSHSGVPPDSSMSEQPDKSHEGAHESRSLWARVKGWFGKEPGRHDSYVSNVTNPDDRRFIPRR
jgi:hypothetical protein